MHHLLEVTYPSFLRSPSIGGLHCWWFVTKSSLCFMCLRLCGIPSKKRMIFKSHASVAVSSFPPPPPYPLRLYCHGKEEAERIFELTHKNSFYIQHLFHVHRKTSSISKDCLIFMEKSCLFSQSQRLREKVGQGCKKWTVTLTFDRL